MKIKNLILSLLVATSLAFCTNGYSKVRTNENAQAIRDEKIEKSKAKKVAHEEEKQARKDARVSKINSIIEKVKSNGKKVSKSALAIMNKKSTAKKERERVKPKTKAEKKKEKEKEKQEKAKKRKDEVAKKKDKAKKKKDEKGKTNIDFSFMLGVSPNYTLLGAPNYADYFPVLNKYHINMLRVFCYSGWGDDSSSYVYKGWRNNDCGDMDPAYLNRVANFVSTANSYGIIVILSLYHRNGDPFSYAMGGRADQIRSNVQSIVRATMGMAVIYEPINEDADQGFCNYVQGCIREVWPSARTVFYQCSGANYRIIHTVAKGCITGVWEIQSNDKGGYTSVLSQGDYYTIASQAKSRGSHVEFLFYWNNGKPQNRSPWEMESNYQEALNQLSTLR